MLTGNSELNVVSFMVECGCLWVLSRPCYLSNISYPSCIWNIHTRVGSGGSGFVLRVCCVCKLVCYTCNAPCHAHDHWCRPPRHIPQHFIPSSAMSRLSQVELRTSSTQVRSDEIWVSICCPCNASFLTTDSHPRYILWHFLLSSPGNILAYTGNTGFVELGIFFLLSY